MSVNFNSENTPNSNTTDSQAVAKQQASPFDTLPEETLHKILRYIPIVQLAQSNTGTNAVNRRFRNASVDVYRRRSQKSPKADPVPSRAPHVALKKTRKPSFSTRVHPLNLDK